MEAIAGKKKSKFWFYAVEPVAGQPAAPAALASASARADADTRDGNVTRDGTESTTDEVDVEMPPPSESNTNGAPTEKSVERSLSPSSRMDES